MIRLLFSLTFVTLTLADGPIVDLKADCPDTNNKSPSLHLTADVPAYALAKCRNGDKELEDTDEVNFELFGSFDQSYTGTRCLFYKKVGSNTYTVDIEVGWGETNTQIIQQRKIHTISCAYDDHGEATSETETVNEWFLNAWEAQTLLGGNSSATFSLKVIDVLDREINGNGISIGRKLRLVAEDLSGQHFFRALSCSVQNAQGRYYILRAGCGDGLIFPKIIGFLTKGRRVFSPYFEAFKLSGADNTVEFQCRFTECDGPCDGDSCTVLTTLSAKRRKRYADFAKPSIVATSLKYHF